MTDEQWDQFIIAEQLMVDAMDAAERAAEALQAIDAPEPMVKRCQTIADLASRHADRLDEYQSAHAGVTMEDDAKDAELEAAVQTLMAIHFAPLLRLGRLVASGHQFVKAYKQMGGKRD